MILITVNMECLTRKTRTWNNLELWEPRPLGKTCGNSIANKHIAIARRGPITANKNNQFKQSELDKIPRDLVEDIFLSLTNSQ